ncbi:Uncharacterized protein RZ54_03900 [Apilactobacillus kunkeei]|uniref:hypothetical protein n=1 Tax=Apilactobacillus kunkeei TaxID=148814 RepID=UPI0006C46E01|nr:hypothetical protein [Apilactobacillus kunkeei]KOY75438.1 Uncharacterized protein RZ54_03900 [Apilactobacillus kunkeei]
MTERQLIQQILNTVDVEYNFENVDSDNSAYDIKVFQQKKDRRPLKNVNDELKKYFNEAGFNYTEHIGDDLDLKISK